MDGARELLSNALSNEGYICIMGKSPTGVIKHFFFEAGDYDGAVQKADELSQSQWDSYFCTSTLNSNALRRLEHVHHVKLFKLDLDIGADDAKKYPSLSAAKGAYKQFCKDYNFPQPVVVVSGNGLHLYWILDTAMQPREAMELTTHFKHICAMVGFKSDAQCTGDLVRVLRVPDTFNYKDVSEPKHVLYIHKGNTTTYPLSEMRGHIERVYDAVGKLEDAGDLPAGSLIPGQDVPAHLRGAVDSVAEKLAARKPKSMQILINRSESGNGCNQIKRLYDERATCSEPEWRAILSIAQACNDRETAIHMVSVGHHGYDFNETIKKAEGTNGPYTCRQLEQDNPHGCKGCPYKGKITSPIQLGEYVERATGRDNIVFGVDKALGEQELPYEIPELPYPYFRGKNGGVWKVKDDNEQDGVPVTDLDFYMVDRLRDQDKFLLQFRLHHPKDGVMNIMIPSGDVGATDKLREFCNGHGILVVGKRLEMVRDYIFTWARRISIERAAPLVKQQFGWTENTKSFVVGEREYTPDHTFKYSPVAPNIAPVAEHFRQAGDFGEWKKCVNHYARDGMEPHAFLAMMSFGSVLLGLTVYRGAVVNAYSQASGSGKTTAAQVGLAAWGNPNELMMTFRDSSLSMQHRLGVYNSFPLLVDEVTNMRPEEFGNLLFASSQGKGRSRMKSNSNEERRNDTSWRAPIITTSNKSFVDHFQAEKSGSEGELMRLLEVRFPDSHDIGKEEADRMFGPMATNYGHAGPIFIDYVLANMDTVQGRLVDLQKQFDRDSEMRPQERFWSVLVATTLLGQQIAEELGLHDIDFERQYKWCIKMVKEMRRRVGGTTDVESKFDVLGEFLSEHLGGTLVVRFDPKSKRYLLQQTPKSGEVVVRFEENLGRTYIPVGQLNTFLNDRRISLEEFRNKMASEGKFKGIVTKRLLAGLGVSDVGQKVYVFQTDEPEDDEALKPFLD